MTVLHSDEFGQETLLIIWLFVAVTVLTTTDAEHL